MTNVSKRPLQSIQDVLERPPLIHGRDPGEGDITHGLLPQALSFIEQNAKPGDFTLETGSGLSTIAFALSGADHTCVVPNPNEPERIVAFCRKNGISTESVHFEVAFSEDVLPSMELGELDLVLIDGSHSFPQVFIDWFYAQAAIRVGGILIVDDVHVWTGRVLRDFLVAEPEWDLIHSWAGRTVAFRKLRETTGSKSWEHQRYVMQRTRPQTLGRARMAVDLLKEGQYREFVRRTRALVTGKTP